jgi:hypothetical protein
MAYAQCMKARGNIVEMDSPPPVREVVVYERPRPVYVAPSPYYAPRPYYRPRPYYY